MASAEIWDTPGARRWFGAVDAALERRTAVIMCQPAIGVPVAAAERVTAAAAARRPRIRVLSCPPDLPTSLGDGGRNADLLGRAVAEYLDLPVPTGEHYGVAALLASEETDESVLHIDACATRPDAASAWCRFAAAAAGASKDLPAAERPAVVVHVVADGSVEIPPNDTNLRTLWWWGVLAPLDVAVLVDAADRDPVDAATIGEVARWDVELVSRLAERWDGDPASLAIHVAEHARPSASCSFDGPAGPTPGPATHGWCAGTVERWAGMLDPHVTLAPEGVLHRRRWHAQVSVVYPWLEEVRAVLADRVVEAARSARLDEERVEVLAGEELGQLKHLAMFEYNLDLSPDVRDLLGRAVTARNELAHLRAVSPTRLAGLRAAAARSGVVLALLR